MTPARNSLRIAVIVAAWTMLPPTPVGSSPTLPPPGSSAVLNAGRVRLRVTNQGHLGRLSWDTPGPTPGAQWPGPSHVECLQSIELLVGALDFTVSDPAELRRVSFSGEWQPATPTIDDGIRSSDASTPGGRPFVDDDGDARIDEEWLDGRDEDGDGLIDEDFASMGGQMLSLTMRDDTPASYLYSEDPSYLPLHLECRQRVWAFNDPGYANFTVAEYRIRNESGHELDSVVVGWQVDLAAGPLGAPGGPGSDDVTLPQYPSAALVQVLDASDPRRQFPHDPGANFWAPPDSALCPRMRFGLQGFSVADDDGDLGVTTAIPSFLLVDHTFDPTGIRGPMQVQFRAFRFSNKGVAPWEGGLPTSDVDRWWLASGHEGVDVESGELSAELTMQVGDQIALCSVGPFLRWQPGEEIRATIVLGLATGALPSLVDFVGDRGLQTTGALSNGQFIGRYPSLANALAVAHAFDGVHVPAVGGFPGPDGHGREQALRAAPSGQWFEFADCRDEVFGQTRTVRDDAYTMFDLDCDFCTGPYDYVTGQGYEQRHWVLPPPSTVGVEPPSSGQVSLGAWSPNPSTGTSRIRLDLTRADHVSASIHDAAGRRVRDIASHRREAGPWILAWDGLDTTGRRAVSGMYWLRVAVGDQTFTRPLVLLTP